MKHVIQGIHCTGHAFFKELILHLKKEMVTASAITAAIPFQNVPFLFDFNVVR